MRSDKLTVKDLSLASYRARRRAFESCMDELYKDLRSARLSDLVSSWFNLNGFGG